MRLEALVQDALYALRTFRREFAFFAAAVAIIAIGIGANTAIFSVVNGLLFRPIPFKGSERLVWIANAGGGPGLSSVTSRVSTFLGWQKQTQSFEEMAAYFAFFDYGSYTMLGVGEPQRLIGVGVSQNLLSFLGVKPLLGRNFNPEECKDNVQLTVILTHGLWQRQFGSDPNVIGRRLSMDQGPATVVGVLPADFDFSAVFVPGSRVDMLVPFPLTQATDRYGNTLAAIGRLKPGVTIDQAAAEFQLINQSILRADPGRWRFDSALTSLREHLTGRFRRSLLLLLSAVGLVLLIACANLSNLLLARGAARRKEVAIRSALGAGRGRLVRQMLTESMILSACGALVGLALAWAGVRFVISLQAIDIPLLRTVTVDGSALAFTAVIALVTGVIFGVVPAFQATRANEAESLKDTGRGMSGSKRSGLTQKALVVSEVALACILLVGAGLLVRSFLRVLDIDLGFRAENTMAWRVPAGQQRKSARAQTQFYDQLTQAVASIPGVISAGVTDALPLSRDRSWGLGAKGATYPKDQYPIAHPRIVDWRYLKTMGIPFKAGRDFAERDTADSEKVLILNEKAANRLWPGQDPIGRIAQFNGERKVVGVVGNVRHLAIEQEGGFEAYIPVADVGSNSVDLVVRSRLAPEVLVPAVRKALRAIDPEVTTEAFQPLGDLVDRAVSPRKFMTMLLGGFAAGALVLALVGIYGVVSYSVTQRRQEIGIRMALGASPGRVQKQIVLETVGIVAVGLVIGIGISLLVTRFTATLLYQLQPTDPLTFGVTIGTLLLAATAAGFIPSLRASRVDPMSVLRSD